MNYQIMNADMKLIFIQGTILTQTAQNSRTEKEGGEGKNKGVEESGKDQLAQVILNKSVFETQ